MIFKSEIIKSMSGSGETEVEYVQRIINLITSMDSRITCNTTAAAQYADTSATATIDFNINNSYVLRLKRAAVNSTTTTYWWFSIIIDGVEYYKVSGNNGLRFWTSASTANSTIGSGAFKITTCADNDFLFVWIGMNYDTGSSQFNDIFQKNYCTAFITDEDDEVYATALNKQNSTDLASGEFYKCSNGSAGFSLIKPLNYIDQVGTISYLMNMYTPIANSGAPAKYAQGLMACSTRSLGDSLTFDGKNYFAVGTNILAEITASES